MSAATIYKHGFPCRPLWEFYVSRQPVTYEYDGFTYSFRDSAHEPAILVFVHYKTHFVRGVVPNYQYEEWGDDALLNKIIDLQHQLEAGLTAMGVQWT